LQHYVDDLIDLLRRNYGLHVGSVFIGAILCADYCGSCTQRNGLQKLIDIWVRYGLHWDIQFNCKKSQIASFGGTHRKPDTNRTLTLLETMLPKRTSTVLEDRVSNHCHFIPLSSYFQNNSLFLRPCSILLPYG